MSQGCPALYEGLDRNNPAQVFTNTAETKVGTYVTFTCKEDGYQIYTNSTHRNGLTCQATLQWDYLEPICIKAAATTGSGVISQQDQTILIAVSSAIGGLLLLTVIGCLIYFCCIRRRRRPEVIHEKRIHHNGYNNNRHLTPIHKESYYGHNNEIVPYRNGKRSVGNGDLGPPPATVPGLADGSDLPSAVIYDPARKIWIDEYDVKLKVPRPQYNGSKVQGLTPDPWAITRYDQGKVF